MIHNSSNGITNAYFTYILNETTCHCLIFPDLVLFFFCKFTVVFKLGITFFNGMYKHWIK